MTTSTKTSLKTYREGRTILKVPQNGIQLFEVTNLDSSTREIEITLVSARLVMLESQHSRFNIYHFKKELKSKESVVFGVMDKGHIEFNDSLVSYSYEGSVRISVSRDPVVNGQKPPLCALNDLLIVPTPETDSYREFCKASDRFADCKFKSHQINPYDKMIKIEAISKDKYGKNELPGKLNKLTDEEKKMNRLTDVNALFGIVERAEKEERIKTDAELDEEAKKWLYFKLDLMELLEKDTQESETSKSSPKSQSEAKKSEKSKKSSKVPQKSAKPREKTPPKVLSVKNLPPKEPIEEESEEKTMEEDEEEEEEEEKKKKCIIS